MDKDFNSHNSGGKAASGNRKLPEGMQKGKGVKTDGREQRRRRGFGLAVWRGVSSGTEGGAMCCICGVAWPIRAD